MKEIIKDLYNIDALTFIKISDKVYKIKTIDKEYALKYIEQSNLDFIIEKLNIINVNSFVYPLKNVFNEYTSSFEGVYFIVLPWVETDNVLLKDLKLEFFLDFLAELHNKSFYTARVNGSFFDETYDFIASKIDKTNEYIDEYMSKIERLDYKSPSQWLFLLNYPIYKDALNKADKSLDNFREKCENKTTVKMALTYNNFNYKHISLKSRKILGIENIELTSPVYDVFYTFSSLNEISVDTKKYYERYFKTFIFDDYEKEWLLSLLYIPRIENLSNNEISNIKEVTSSLNYIRNCEDIAQIIKQKKEIDNK